jgi:heat shock protein HslJ
MIRRMSLVAFALLATHSAVLAQDAPTAAPEKKPGALAPVQPKKFPSNITFTLKTINGKPASGDKPTIQFDPQLRFRGFAGCNTYSAIAYPLKNQGLAVGPIATTKKECGAAVMEEEKAFLLAVRTSHVWNTKDSNLYIAGDKGELVFERSLF